MPATRSVGRESCRGEIRPPIGYIFTCMGTTKALTETPPGHDWSNGPPRHLPVLRAGHWLRDWEAYPDRAQEKADELGCEISDLLCRGCNERRLRLIAEGLWP